jgi:RimJ/RimL family protein N-acetyltransferase
MQIETQRLIIRSWQENDIDAYAGIVAKPEVMKFIKDSSMHDFETARDFVMRAIKVERERPWILWAVQHKTDQRLIGFCGFSKYKDDIEIGWRLNSEYWRRGLGTEAAGAVIEYGWNDLGFEHVVAIAQMGNTASIKIMKKIGMTYRETTIDKSCGREIVVYEANRTECPGVPADS